MYYYKNNDGNLEKLLKSYEDYLRNTNKIDYKIGENKPSFDLDREGTDTRGLDGLEYGFNPAVAEAHDVTIEIEAATANPSISQKATGELANKILPFINSTLEEHDYARKPIKSDNLDIRILCEIVDKSMQRAALEIDSVKEIMLEPKGGAWDRRDLLYGVFEEVVIGEIYCR